MKWLFAYSSEVENIDKEIRELRESFNNSSLSKQSVQEIEVNLTQICPPSASPNLAASYSQSPLKIIEMVMHL